MSIPFSSTSGKNGIIQLIERNLDFPDGTITGSPLLMAQFTGDVNLALDWVYSKIFPVSGTWQFDDSNHTGYPIITGDLVSGQRDYSFVTDDAGNLILDIYKVMVKSGSTGAYKEIKPKDQQSESDTLGFTDGLDVGGVPMYYDKTANGIFLDPVPNYNSDEGLQIFINREGSYFTVSDTTKKAGFSGLFHEYLALRPSYAYANRKQLANAERLKRDMLEMESAIESHFARRERDVRKRMVANVENTK